MRKLNFPEYDANKLGNNFVHCSTCDRLHSFQRTVVARSQVAILWV
jgi:hypothetical protein